MPTLKTYSFTRTNEYGAAENCYVTFRAMSFDWSDVVFYADFRNFESVEESDRGTAPRESLNLKLAGNDLLAQLMQSIPEGDRELPFVEIFSNKIWTMALETPFVPDYSEIDANTDFRVRNLKSLTDLDAVLIPVEL